MTPRKTVLLERQYWIPLILPLLLLFLCQEEKASTEICKRLSGLEGIAGIQCGLLIVPENHIDPASEGKLEISYTIIPAKQSVSQRAPMIFLMGGPGNASLTAAQVRNWLDSDLRTERDIILFDQRGTGLSSPLPNMIDELYDIMGSDITLVEEGNEIQDLFEDFSKKADKSGIDLQYYNSIQSAHDVGALMSHLGYERYNLYGVSYGTRLARIVQEIYPEYLNGVILNSPDPIKGDFLLNRLKSYSLALERVLSYCESDNECRTQFPNLKEDYFELLSALQVQPVRVDVDKGAFYINAQDGTYFVRRALYSTNSRTLVPALIAELTGGGGPIIKGMVENEFWSSYNFSMWLAVERYEMYDGRNTAAIIDRLYDSLSLLPVKLGHFSTIYKHLGILHQADLSTEEKMLDESAVPTLILVNQFDPITPPENGKILMEKLSNGKLFILDEGGHGGGNLECRNQVMSDFMNTPYKELDVSCLKLYSQSGQ